MVIRATINELKEKRAKLVSDARKIVEKAEAEKRGLSSDEKSQWEQMQADVDSIKDRVDVLEKTLDQDDDEEDEGEDEEREDEEKDKKKDDEDDGERTIKLADGRVARIVEPGKNRRSRTRPGTTPSPRGGDGVAEVRRLPGEPEHSFRTRQRRATPEYRKAWFDYLAGGFQAIGPREMRAIQADTDVIGGYLVAPQEFVAELIKFVDNLVYVRQKARKFTVTEAQTLGAPSLDTDPADSDWTSELATGTEDSSMRFGKRELTPHPLAKRIKVSNKILRMASIASSASAYDAGSVTGGADNLVMQRFGYKFAVSEEQVFYTGNGAQQPLGLFTASSRGISTARDVVTGNTTGFTPDCFFTAKYTLKVQYHSMAEWFFNRTAMPLIRTLKDGNGQYLWAAGLAQTPDTLLERPISISEYVPNTFTTGQYVGGLFCMPYYWIVDSVNFQVQRLVELYAEANQTGFIARQELDGMPVLEEAFVRLKTS